MQQQALLPRASVQLDLCPECITLLNDTKTLLAQNASEELIVVYLSNVVCFPFSGALRETCHDLIQDNVPLILEGLSKDMVGLKKLTICK